jgi:uncharacterized protein
MKSGEYPALIIFLRPPELGKVKTRLAATLGPEKALAIYLDLCQFTRLAAEQYPGPSYLYFSDYIPAQHEWSVERFVVSLQKKGDLGERMLDAFDGVLARHGAALIVGTDCPGLDAAILMDAAENLKTHDAVIGPAEDGGYYLLGLKKTHSSLFEELPWSTDQVCALTQARLKALGWTWHVGSILSDIDLAEDWEKWNKFAT